MRKNLFRMFSSQVESSMIDVSKKPKTTRTAIATCTIEMNSSSYFSILNNKLRKTQDKMSLITIAEVAGMMGAKQT